MQEYFNSIKVQLKPGGVGHFGRRFRYFNSIKVQLKRTEKHVTFYIIIFQFHKGTIKAKSNHYE